MRKSVDLEAEAAQAARLVEAYKTLRERYPGYEIRLVPAGTPDNGESEGESSGEERQSNRAVVSEVLDGEWMTIDEIVDATGLLKKQVYGVLTSDDGKNQFERRQTTDRNKKAYKLRKPSTIGPPRV